jgi:hypothetical protein
MEKPALPAFYLSDRGDADACHGSRRFPEIDLREVTEGKVFLVFMVIESPG